MICPTHKVQAKLVPGGVSKKKFNPDGTGKAYSAFYACPVEDCKVKPVEEGTMMVDGPAVIASAKQAAQEFVNSLPEEDNTMTKKDWAKQGEQKNRSNLAAAVLHGNELNWKQLVELEAWVLTGKTPDETNLDYIN